MAHIQILDSRVANFQFNQFVDFAAKSLEAGQSKAIARADPGKASVLIQSRSVSAATADKVAKFLRSNEDQIANDNTRSFFFATVSKMFGGDDNIPKAVIKAMKLGDFGQGKPLTARRIMTVKAAIDDWKDANNLAPNAIPARFMDRVTHAKYDAVMTKNVEKDMRHTLITDRMASKMIHSSLKEMDARLPKAVKNELAEMLRIHGTGMPLKTAKIYSNFLVKTAVQDMFNAQTAKDIAEDMKGWREFTMGDERTKTLCSKLAQRQQTYIENVMRGKTTAKFLPDHPDVFAQFLGDSNRGNWNINGATINLEDVNNQQILEQFLNTVKNPKARQAISILCNQSSLSDIAAITMKYSISLDAQNAWNSGREPLHEIPGAEMIVSRNGERDGVALLSGNGDDLTLGYQISPDGKTATVTVGMEQNITPNGQAGYANKIGSVKIMQQITLDLSHDNPEVTNIQISQTFSNEIYD